MSDYEMPTPTPRYRQVLDVSADTTVIPANVAYPADSGLLARAAGQAGADSSAGAGRGRGPGHGDDGPARAAARRVRQIASRLRTRGQLSREESTAVIRRVTGELADLAEKTAAQAAAVLRNGRSLRRALTGRMPAGCGGP